MSPINYLPSDSGAVQVLVSINHMSLHYRMLLNVRNNLGIAFLTLLVYDHIITFDKEVEWIWTLRWGPPKIIFLLNRYVVLVLLLMASIPEDFYFPKTAVSLYVLCNFGLHFWWVWIVSLGIAQLLLIIRVSSLYGHQKLVTRSLGFLFVVTLAGTTVLRALHSLRLHRLVHTRPVPGCWYPHDPGLKAQKFDYVPVLIFEGMLLLLTAYKVYPHRNELNRTITLLARDSIVYFIIIAGFLAVNLADQFFPVINFLLPSQCVASIAVGRMMMNLRALVMEDSGLTVYTKTLEFNNNPDNSGVEIEDE